METYSGRKFRIPRREGLPEPLAYYGFFCSIVWHCKRMATPPLKGDRTVGLPHPRAKGEFQLIAVVERWGSTQYRLNLRTAKPPYPLELISHLLLLHL